MPTYHLIIKGKVQGVFYRATAKKVADEIGLTGWVKNTADENVEALVTGTKEQIDRFISWCRKGPAAAEVTDVTASQQDEIKFENFLIKR